MKIGTGGFSVIADNEYKLFKIVADKQVQMEGAISDTKLSIQMQLVHSAKPVKWTYKKANKWIGLPIYINKDGEEVDLSTDYSELLLPSDYSIMSEKTSIRAELTDVDGNLYYDEITLYRLGDKTGVQIILSNELAQLQRNKRGEFNLEDLKFSYLVYNNKTLLVEGSGENQFTVKYTYEEGELSKTENVFSVVKITDTYSAEQQVRLSFSINVLGEKNTLRTAYFNILNQSLGYTPYFSDDTPVITYDENGIVSPVEIKIALLKDGKFTPIEDYSVTVDSEDNIVSNLKQEATYWLYTINGMMADSAEAAFTISSPNGDKASHTIELKRRAENVPALTFRTTPNRLTFTYDVNKNILEPSQIINAEILYGGKTLIGTDILESFEINAHGSSSVSVAKSTATQFSVGLSNGELLSGNKLYGYAITFSGYVKLKGAAQVAINYRALAEIVPSPIISTDLSEKILQEIEDRKDAVDSAIDSAKDEADRVKGEVRDELAGLSEDPNAIKVHGNMVVHGTLGADHLVANSIKTGHIEAGAIEAKHIKSEAIEAGAIKADEAFFDKLTASEFWSETVNSAEINADSITAGTIKADHIEVGAIDLKHISSTAYEGGNGLTTVNTVDSKISASADGIRLEVSNTYDPILESINSEVKVTNVDVEYAENQSATVAPESGWQSLAPTYKDGWYIWTRTTKTLGTVVQPNQSTQVVGPVCISGNTGLGVKSIKEYYFWHTTATTAPPSGADWKTTPGTWQPNLYLWTKSIITYTDNSTSPTDPMCVSGAPGADGANSKTITVSGEQVFKYTNNYGSLTGASTIVLSTSVQGVSSPSYTWKVKPSGGAWSTLSDQTATLSVSAAGSYWGAHKQLTFRCELSPSIADEITIVKVTDGAQGVSGNDGKGISSIVNYYLTSSLSTGVTNATAGFGTNIVSTTTTNKYLWSYELITYTNASTHKTPAVIIGTHGATGDTGRGVSSIKEEYLAGPSNTNAPIGTWLTSMPALNDTDKKYLWNKETVTYTTGSPATEIFTKVIAVHGDTGQQGIQGPPGKNGQSQYFHVRYSVNSNGSNMTESPAGAIYMGTAITETSTAPTSNTSYTWSKILGDKGPQGNQGTPGQAGEDGQTPYLHIKYSDNGTNFTANNGETPGNWLGQYVDFSPIDSTVFGDYAWSKIQGPQGNQGIQGPPGPNGQSLYTWVRYADSELGAGMHDEPNGKKYIGFAYNKTSPSESDAPSDYAWSLIEGPQGIQGPDGKIKYTWLKYADTPTSGMEDGPAGKKYMGIAYNKDTATESSNYADYQWSLIQGPQGSTGATGPQGPVGVTGKGVKSTVINYAASSSGTSTPSTGWQDSVPSVGAGQYLWTRTVITYTDNTSSSSYSVGMMGQTGAQGSTGATGTGVSSATVTYQVGTSGTSAPEGGWQTTVPTVPAGQYLWTRTVTSYTNSTSSTSYAVSRMGVDGSAGKGIATISNHYLATSASSGVTTATSGWTTGVQSTDSTKKYLWNYEKITYTDSSFTNTTPAIIGTHSTDGRGISSITEYYLATSASSGVTTATAGWTTTMQTMTTTNRYLWNYEVITYVNGTPASTTGTPKIIGVHGATGAQGNQGIQGPPGPNGQSLYTWVRYADNASGGGINDKPLDKTYIGVAYNKTSPTESNTPSDYTWSLIKGATGAQGPQGATGPQGQSVDIRYVRQQEKPAKPTGNSPSGWSNTISPNGSGYGNVWFSECVKNSSGNVIGSWTEPLLASPYSANLLENHKWSVGTGSDGRYGLNGLSTENIREIDANPFGSPDIIWKAINVDTASDGDGGWNHSGIPVKDTGTYRVSVFMKQKKKSDSTVYLGCDPVLTLAGTENTNPYFWSGNLPDETKWYLVVGYIYPHNTTETTSHPDAGIYDLETGKKIQSITTFKMKPGTTTQEHRAYQYYSVTPGTDSFFYEPRFELCDGQEPTVQQILRKGAQGDAGADAYTLILSNENHSFPVEPGGQPSSLLSTTTTITALKGATSIAATIGAISTGTSGLTASVSGSTVTVTMATNVTASATSGSFNIPITVDGKSFSKTFSWSKAIKGATGAQGIAGVAAKYVTVTGEQAFKYASGASTPVPSNITLLANVNNVSGSGQWYYLTPGSTTANSISGQTGTSLSIAHNASYWESHKSLTFRYSIGGVYDEITVLKLYDGATGAQGGTGATGPQGPQGGTGATGAAGADAYSVILSNESHTFPVETNGKPSAAISTTTEVIAYKGTAAIAASAIGVSVSGAPTGITSSVNSSTKAVTITMGTNAPSATNGTFTINVTVDGKTFAKKFSWSKAIKGNTGSTGAPGSNGISITKVDIEYGVSSSNSTPPSSWSTDTPSWTDGRYIWSRTKTYYSSGNPVTSNPACITGGKGGTGMAGQSVTAITEEYCLHTSKKTKPTSGWKENPDPWTPGKYMWTRSKITYANPTTTGYTEPYCDASWEAIDGIELGGRNYATAKKIAATSYTTSGAIIDTNHAECPNGFYLVGTNGGTHTARLANVIDSNGDWTVSFDFKGSQSTAVSLIVDVADGDSYTYRTSADNKWTRVSHTFNVTRYSGNPSVYHFVDFQPTWAYLFVKNLKVEKGNKTTDWTPAPEDTQHDIDVAYGLNQWKRMRYDNINLGSAVAYPTFNHINGKVPSVEDVLADNVNLISGLGGTDYFIAHLKTNVFVPSAKSITLTPTSAVDDTASFFLNGNKVSDVEASQVTTFALKAGWNSIDILFYEHAGGNVFTLDKKLSDHVEKMGYAIGHVNTVTSSEVKAAVEIASNEINLSVKEKIEEVGIGGVNIIPGTKDFDSNWTKPAGSTVSSGIENTFSGTQIIRLQKPTSGYYDLVLRGKITPDKDAYYTLSFWARADVNSSFNSYFYPSNVASGVNDAGTTTTATDGSIGHSVTTTWTKKWVTWKTTTSTTGVKDLIVARLFAQAAGWVEIAGVQLEKGNKATDWSYSPGDIYSKTESNSQISVLQEQINLSATKTEVETALSEENTTKNYGVELFPQVYKNGVLPVLTGGGTSISNNCIVVTNKVWVRSDFIPISRTSKLYCEATFSRVSGGAGQVYFGIEQYGVNKTSLGANDLVQYFGSTTGVGTFKSMIGLNSGCAYIKLRILNSWNDVLQTISVSDIKIRQLNSDLGQFNEWKNSAEIKITPEAITNTVTSSTSWTELNSKFQQTADSIIATFTGVGGYNLIKNSTGNNGTSYWSTNAVMGVGQNHHIGSPNSNFLYLDNGTTTSERYAFSNRFKLLGGKKYTLSGWFHNYTKCPSFDIVILMSNTVEESDTGTSFTHHVSSSGHNTNNAWQKKVWTFTVPEGTKSGLIRIDNNGYNSAGQTLNRVHFNSLVLVEGEMQVQWSPHPSEVYEGNTTIDANGIKVTHSNIGTSTELSADGFYIKNSQGETVGSLASESGLTILSAEEVYANNINLIYSGDANIYVKSSHTGESDGSSTKPYKMLSDIQGHFDKYGRYLTKKVFVNIEGTFTEDLKIAGIGGHIPMGTGDPEMGTEVLVFQFSASSVMNNFVAWFRDCTVGIRLHGNGKPVSGNTNTGCQLLGRSVSMIQAVNCVSVHASGFRVNLRRASNRFPNFMDLVRSRGYVNDCDIVGTQGIMNVHWMSQGHVRDCRGRTNDYLIIAYASGVGSIYGKVPMHTTQSITREGGVYVNNSASTMDSIYSPPEKPTTSDQIGTFNQNGYGYWSEQYNSWNSNGHTVYQGNWGYGNNRGVFRFDDSAIRSWLSNGTPKNGSTITLKRANSSGYSGATNVYLYGSNTTHISGSAPATTKSYGHLGTLAWGETKTFNLPTSFVNDLKSGTIKSVMFYVPNCGVKQHYIKFEGTCTLKLKATKPV